MAAMTDLDEMLRALKVGRHTEPVTFVHRQAPEVLGDGILAEVVEPEGVTVVITVAEAERRGWPVEFVAAWLTLELHGALEAVGLTAAVSTALAAEGIPCNVIAGYFHDHLLVPADRADDAMAAIDALSRR